jgi:GTP-binding protein Era
VFVEILLIVLLVNQTNSFRSGYVSIIGRPNVGKSTLLNQLVAQKVAATSNRPQTTRNKITGVVHLTGAQIILVDTPGIHATKRTLNEMMVQASISTYTDVDLLLVLIDAVEGFLPEDEFVLKSMEHATVPKILVINKIDLVEKPNLLTLFAEANNKSVFKEIIPVSALKDDGMELLKDLIVGYLPEGPEYFPKDMITDCTETFLLEEIIREKVLNLTRFEVPHSVAVIVENMEDPIDGLVRIDATLYTEKTSQKKIIIGQGGSMLKSIGRIARTEIEKRLGVQVFLKLFVKVKPNWRDQKQTIKQFVYLDD